MIDVLVAGGGPAGWAVAAACGHQGLTTELVDPAPERPWRATYGSWRDELPEDVASAVAACGRGVAIGTREHSLGWQYAVFDNVALRDRFAAAPVRVRRGRVHDARAEGDGVMVRLTESTGHGQGRPVEVRAAVVLDATGAHRALLGGHPAADAEGPGRRADGNGSRRRVAAEQTAVGVRVPAAAARRLVASGEALFMDWRPYHGESGWPTFLYAVPVSADRVLLEETSLARRPGLNLSVLRRRLRARLAHHGIATPGADEERVRFVVDTPLPAASGWRGPVVPFGAASPLVHPATGFSVATAMRLAPRVAAAIAAALPAAGSRAAGRAAWRAVWSPPALSVHALRRRSLEALLRIPPGLVPDFFDAFFALPDRHRWAYLTGREDLVGTAAAMGALFSISPWWLRRRLVFGGLAPRVAPALGSG